MVEVSDEHIPCYSLAPSPDPKIWAAIAMEMHSPFGKQEAFTKSHDITNSF